VLRAEIREQRTRFRVLLWSLLAVMVGAFGIIMWQGRETREERAETRTAIRGLQAWIAQLESTLTITRGQADSLRNALAAERDPSRRAVLMSRLQTVQQRATSIQTATGVDWNAVVRLNRPAVAMISVRFPDGAMWAGTAFSVSPQGLMLTNRHLVVNNAGQRALEVAVQFSNSREVHPARVERVSRDADLATIQLESAGPFPAVAGIADTPAGDGDPIGLIGFPFGRDLPQPGGVVTASLFNGSISRALGDSLLQLDAWSGTGASGSPIFDRSGRVIGVEFGGVADTGGRVVLGLPIRRALSLLQ
jgi:S1-C subfamily serine protease